MLSQSDGTNPGSIHYADINASYDIDSLNLLSASFGGYFYKLNVQGVSFTPDPSFVKALKAKISTQNKYGRGAAGRNKPYTREQIVEFLDNHLKEHHSITRKQMQYALNITEYRAQKWLDELTAEEFSKYYCKKQGTTYVYYRYGWE